MKTKETGKKAILSTLWIFLTLNYLYCDIVGLMDFNLLQQYLSGTVNGIEMNESFLLAAAFLMEIPIAMVFLSRILNFKANRVANILAGAIMTLVQSATLLVGAPSKYYVFFSMIEIATSIFITWYAIKWRNPDQLPIEQEAVPVSHKS